MSRARSTHGRDENCMQNFGRKSWRKRPLRRPERSGRNMDLREIGCEGVDRMHLGCC